MADKQYYTNLNSGETSIESRFGAKILMNNGLTISAARRTEYLDQLRKDGYQGNINLNLDEETSIVYMGIGQVDLNQQGNINQQSINLSNQNNVISPTRTPGEMPAEETIDPPTITKVEPLSGYKGDPITIEGTGFIEYETVASFGMVIADTTGVISNTKLIATVGDGADGEITIKTSAGSATYTDQFDFLGVRGVEGGDLPEEESEGEDPTNQTDEGNTIPDDNETPSEVPNQVPTPSGCPQPGIIRPARTNIVKIIRPNTIPPGGDNCGNQCVARDNAGNIVPLYDFVAAAKTCIGISTGGPDRTISSTKLRDGTTKITRGGLGCAMAVHIIYAYACGHSMRWVEENARTRSPIVGRNLGVVYGTYYVNKYLLADPVNFETIVIYSPKQGGDYWKNVSMKMIQPGDIINTVTAANHGHIGVVIDEYKSPGVLKIISNSSSAYNPTLAKEEGTILNNYDTYSWYFGRYPVAPRSGVGPTVIHRFKCGRGAEWGKTIAIPPQ